MTSNYARGVLSQSRVLSFKRLLAISVVYQLFSKLVGAERARREIAAKFICAKPGEVVVDYGCGPADILEHLPPVDYVGIDISERYVASAQKRFGQRGKFICGFPSDLHLENKSDLAMGIGVLHHLADQEVRDLLRIAYENLGSGGRLVTVDPTLAPGQHPLARWLALRDRGKFVRSPEDLLEIIKGVFPDAQAQVRHDLLRFPYSHVICTASRN